MGENGIGKVTRLLADTYAEIILSATYTTARSALDLTMMYGIPIAACYRKIHELEDANLLVCVEERKTPRGKTIKMYRSNLKEAHLTFENGEFRVLLRFKSSDAESEWLSLKLPSSAK